MKNLINILKEIEQEVAPMRGQGKNASYIPYLARVDADKFGMCVHPLHGEEIAIGDSEDRFSIQSIVKVFSLAMALVAIGTDVWKRVGMEPSGNAFNSIIQLESEHGIPRNPLINAGAIVISDILIETVPDVEQRFIEFIRALSGNDQIDYNQEISESEQSVGYLNKAIGNMLKYYGTLHGDVERVLHFYFQQCSICMNCRDLARAFSHFANHSQSFAFGDFSLTTSSVKHLNAIMQTCGFYNGAGEYSYRVGLPGKSGVGGGIAAICPNHYSVAVWSPGLDDKGNSVVGMKALELLTTKTAISIF